MQRCSGMTRKGLKCKRNSNCLWHKQETCAVCFDLIQRPQSHTTTCKHFFHSECIRRWFETSDVCPMCRSPQNDDPLIIFKHRVHEVMSQNYLEVIQSLEDELDRIRSRRRQRAQRDA